MANVTRDQNRIPGLLTANVTGGLPLPISGFFLSGVGAAAVAIVDGSGSQITSFGGGTQYTDAASTVAHPTGTMPVYDNAGTISKVSVANGLPVQPATGASWAVTGTFWQATQPISAASLPLPTGAATAAKQPALGTAGSASSDVLTVQGIASMTALKVDGSAVTQPVSGTVTANAGTNLNTSALALESGGNLATIAGAVVAQATALGSTKVALMGGSVTTNAPTFTTGNINQLSLTTAGGLRIDLKDSASNTNNFNVNLAASAATVTVTASNLSTNIAQIAGATASTAASGILLVGNADGAGNKLTTNSSTYTAKFALDGNLLGTLGTAFTTAGKVDIKAADGDVFVRQATAANLNATVVGTGTFAVQAAQSGNWTSRIVGNAGATLDSTVGAGSAPTNQVVVGSVYNTSAPAPTNGQAMALQADQAGNVRIAAGIALTTLSAWNSGTALNATQTIFTNSGVQAVAVQLVQTTTLTAGAVTFEVTYDGSNWVTIAADQVLDPTSATLAQISLPYTVQASTNKPFYILTHGAQGLRVKLSTQITGSGTVTPNYALLSTSNVKETIAFSPTAANFNVTLGTGSNTIGSLTANQSVNVAQINGVTPLMGNGTTGTGSQRVTVSSDNTGIANWGHGATGSAVPSGATYKGGIAKTALPSAGSDGNLTGAMMDKFGRQVVLAATIRDLTGTQTTTISNSTSETTIVTAAASTFNDLVMLIVSNTSASTNTRIDFRDTTAGSVLFSLQSNGGQPPVGFALPVPIPQTSVNTNWTAQCATATTDIRIYAVFAKNK